ncbi:MAG: BamA/TamA family outer membrane protein [Kofleriaceae bacterium]
MFRARWAIALTLLAAQIASADPEAPPVRMDGRVDPIDDTDSAGRALARTVLYVPRLAIDILWLPIHGAFYASDRYHITDLYYRVFYNANRTIGLVPTAVFVSGFGLSVGGRFVANDVLGDHEFVSFQATTGAAVGDSHREGYLFSVHTGDRFGKKFRLSASANYDRRPADPFDGIGNGERMTTAPAMPVDPNTNDTSVDTKYRYREERVALTANIKPIKELSINVTGALTDLHFEDSTQGTYRISQVYDTTKLSGFDSGVQHAYGELELRWDSRRRSSVWEPIHNYTQGQLVSVFGGRIDRLDGGRDFWRYGGEVQQFIRLAPGPRVLILRARATGVTGSRDDVPFTELAMLGGGDFLRGYDYNRFRDRVAALGSIQYEWDVSHFADAYIFTDVGRVYEAWDAVTLSGLRVGYGVGLDIHGESSFLFTVSVASSIDGGMLLNLAFNQPINGLQTWR